MAAPERFVIIYHSRNEDAALMAEAELSAWGVDVERMQDDDIPPEKSYIVKLSPVAPITYDSVAWSWDGELKGHMEREMVGRSPLFPGWLEAARQEWAKRKNLIDPFPGLT